MPLYFNTLLREAGIDPKDVRLMRHKDNSLKDEFSTYAMWRDNIEVFEKYQSIQKKTYRTTLSPSKYWASFIVNLSGDEMFAGLYELEGIHSEFEDIYVPGSEEPYSSIDHDHYELKLSDLFQDFIGKLIIDWGAGKLAWIQKAENQDKEVLEIRQKFKEPDFIGYMKFIQPLSRLDRLPFNWIDSLKSANGVYLLTCPESRELYVGSATGEDGFWGRWQNYIKDGHGGNLGLKDRDKSDYQVSILQVAGSNMTKDEILKAEGIWQEKLKSNEIGLNRNLAGKSDKIW